VLIEHVSLPKTYHASNFSKLVAKENMFSCFNIVFFLKVDSSHVTGLHLGAHMHTSGSSAIARGAKSIPVFVFWGDFLPGFVWGKVVWCGLGVSRAG